MLLERLHRQRLMQHQESLELQLILQGRLLVALELLHLLHWALWEVWRHLFLVVDSSRIRKELKIRAVVYCPLWAMRLGMCLELLERQHLALCRELPQSLELVQETHRQQHPFLEAFSTRGYHVQHLLLGTLLARLEMCLVA